jgi:hypothetical protein
MRNTSLFEDILQWSATVLTILGALLSSMNLFPWNIVAFNAGGIFWLIFAIRIRSNSMIVTNSILLLIYVVGMFCISK